MSRRTSRAPDDGKPSSRRRQSRGPGWLSQLSVLLTRFFSPGRGGLSVDDLEEIRGLLPRLERISSEDRWPTVAGRPMSLCQWAAILRELDRRPGRWDGYAEPRSPETPATMPDPGTAVNVMSDRFGAGTHQEIQAGLWHPQDDRPFAIADDPDLQREGSDHTARGGELADAHWRDDEPEPDPYPDFGVRPKPTN
jgi:hypothetical protein